MLPLLITLKEFGGDVEHYLDQIYRIYLDEVVNGRLTFLGLPISCQYRPANHGKHFGFWHLISEGINEESRVPSLRRCERIRWIPYVIKQAGNETIISCWQNRRGSNKHIILWLSANDFLVVLARRKSYLLLKTAYLVEYKHRRRKLEREMLNYPDPRKGWSRQQAAPDTPSTIEPVYEF